MPLFDPNTEIEWFDPPTSDKEAECCCLKVWTSNPNGFAKEGELRFRESAHHGPLRWPWQEPVDVLGHEVIIHMDYILDYSPPSSPSVPWPKHSRWDWSLGPRDDHTLPTRGLSVRDRLGLKRDRSPPPGSGAATRGFRAGDGHHRRRGDGRNGTGRDYNDKGASSSRGMPPFGQTMGGWSMGAAQNQHRYMSSGCASTAMHGRPPLAPSLPAGLHSTDIMASLSPAQLSCFDIRYIWEALEYSSDPMLLESTIPQPMGWSDEPRCVGAPMRTQPAQYAPGMLVGPNGEPWPATTTQQATNSFGPLYDDYDTDALHAATGSQAPVTQVTPDGLLDVDAEQTSLPPGLLDSPSRDSAGTGTSDLTGTLIQCFVDNITKPPPRAVLPLPSAN